jgi:hypothetical protein
VHDYFAGTQGAVPPPGSAGPPAYAPPAVYQPWTAPQPSWPTASPPAPQRTGRPLLLGVVGLVVVVAAVLLGRPVYGELQAKREASRTTVTLPAQIVGMQRLADGAQVQQVAKLMGDALAKEVPNAARPLVGLYGGGGQVMVITGARYLSKDDQRAFLTGVGYGLTQSGALGQVGLSEVPNGGRGRMSCADARGATACAWADNGSYGLVMVLKRTSHAAAVALAAQVRTAVVRRA